MRAIGQKFLETSRRPGVDTPRPNPYNGPMKYHIDIFMPDEIKDIKLSGRLRPTRHAKREAKRDKYGGFEIPKSFDSARARLIEAVMDGGKFVKGLYRTPYDEVMDLCLVLNTETLQVITAWLNRRDDNHKTLDGGQYKTA